MRVDSISSIVAQSCTNMNRNANVQIVQCSNNDRPWILLAYYSLLCCCMCGPMFDLIVGAVYDSCLASAGAFTATVQQQLQS